MALTEKVIKEQGTGSPERYATRVRITAAVYVLLYLISLSIAVAVVWRVKLFVTLSQRSNVETLTLLIVFILAAYYLISTAKGFYGALRILWFNSPLLWSAKADGVERKKHGALKVSKESKYVCFDQAVYLEGKPGEPISWDVADKVGKLGEIEIDGVKATYNPIKDGMNDSLFEFLASELERALAKRVPDVRLEITQWSTISEDQAASFHRTVQAFETLGEHLGLEKPPWPSLELTQEDYDHIKEEIRRLVPALRDESFLPNLEYSVKWNVPVLPEPLAFMQLTRNENRADPLTTMGCATLVMFVIMIVLALFIFWPPWVPSM